MSQAQILISNIDSLSKTIYKLKERTFLTPPIPKIDIQKIAMTPRQITKRVLLISGGIMSNSGQISQTALAASDAAQTLGADTSVIDNAINSQEGIETLTALKLAGNAITEESAHLIVYGKLMRDSNGKLVDNEELYPECVGPLGMPDTHPLKDEVRKKLYFAIYAVKMIGIKLQDLLDDIIQAGISIAASITSMASAIAILPLGTGLPVAFAAFQSMISTIMALTAKIADLVGILPDLEFVPMVIPADMVDPILIPINAQLTALNTIMGTIERITNIIPSYPTPPVYVPPINIEVSSNPSDGGITNGGGSVKKGDQTTVNANPNFGHSFINWTSDNKEVSRLLSYTFTADKDIKLVANFSRM